MRCERLSCGSCPNEIAPLETKLSYWNDVLTAQALGIPEKAARAARRQGQQAAQRASFVQPTSALGHLAGSQQAAQSVSQSVSQAGLCDLSLRSGLQHSTAWTEKRTAQSKALHHTGLALRSHREQEHTTTLPFLSA